MMTTIPIVLTVLLIILLIKREFLHGVDSPFARALRRGVNIAIVPLFVIFLLMVGVQLRSGQGSEIAETASATSAQPAPRITPTSAPTANAAPTANVAPLEAPAAPSASPLVPEVARQQVIASEATLRSGQIDAVIAYREGTRSSARLLFDLTASGDERLHMTTLYTGTNAVQQYERIVIGARTWERAAGGAWVALPTQQSVRAQIRTYLPQATRIQNPAVMGEGQVTELRWLEPVQTITNTLSLDPRSGIPQTLARDLGATGAKLTITYSGWNTPVAIAPPATN